MGSRSSAKTQNLLGTVWEYTETKADKTTTVALKFEKATELSQQTTEKQGTVTSAPKTENLTYTFDSKTRKGTITTTSGAAAFTIDIGFKVLKYNGRDYKKK
ncbi:MAG: hypothetical protein LBQ38_10680 [Spirochaetaceae bacterium]|nr:hypothetical protein [Spirochaetaceae bacterium]